MGADASTCKTDACNRMRTCPDDSEGEGVDFGTSEKEVVDIPDAYKASSSQGKRQLPVAPLEHEVCPDAVPNSGAFVLSRKSRGLIRPVPIEVNLVRQGVYWRTLGLLVSPDDDPQYLVVDDIWGPSLITEWNSKRQKENQVRVGDQIISVNGISGRGEAMLQAIQVQASSPGASLKLLIQ
eukprot:TRINITY_DN55103_c0_g1_i1.p2 TRINITY_DN55103_c0_g1~~TRINITY_DN55103_c0_g1_i1.p2  ORF type:complete len:181 (-),score=42.67 TRINITY_DN55103_c0_g1_i1:39-581(-)